MSLKKEKRSFEQWFDKLDPRRSPDQDDADSQLDPHSSNCLRSDVCLNGRKILELRA